MRSVRIVLSAAVVGLAVGLPALAQRAADPAAGRPGAAGRLQARPAADQQTPMQRLEAAEKAVMEMATDLQKPKLLELFKKAHEEMTPLNDRLQKLEAERREILDKMTQVGTAVRTDLNDLLTEDQKALLREKMAAGAGAGAAAGAGAGVMNMIEQRLQELELTADQKAKLSTVRTEMQEKFAKAREKAGGDRQVLMEQMRDILPELRARLQEILTPEQLGKVMPAGGAGGRPGAGAGRGAGRPGGAQ